MIRTNDTLTINKLREISFFQYYTDSEWDMLKHNITEKFFSDGEDILTEGESRVEYQGMYVVSQGSVSVSKSSLSGRYYFVKILKPSDIFINPGTFDGGPSPATLKAIENTQIFFIPREVIIPILAKNPKVIESILLIIAEIIRSAIGVIDGLAFKDNFSRLALFLLNVAKKDVINRKQFSLQFISSCINTVPEVVSRGLKKLADDRIIEITRTKLIILDRKRLEKIASE